MSRSDPGEVQNFRKAWVEVGVGPNQRMDAQNIRVTEFTGEGANYNALAYFYRKLNAHVSESSKKLTAEKRPNSSLLACYAPCCTRRHAGSG